MVDQREGAAEALAALDMRGESSGEGSIGAGQASPPARPKQPGFGVIGAGGSSGSGPIGPLQALGLAIAGAVLTLALAIPLVRRRARRAQSSASPEGPHA